MDNLKEAFVVAQEFLLAVKANDGGAARVRCDAPFLLGAAGGPSRLETLDELSSRLAAARAACGGDDFPTNTVLLSRLSPEDSPPAERAAVEQWLAITSPDGHVMSTGDPLNPGPVKLLVRLKGDRIRIVGLLY